MIQTQLTAADRERHAAALRQARQTHQTIPPLTDTDPELGVADAYAIAQLNVAARQQAGATVTGHKIGLTATAIQQQLGVDEPDYGTLLDEMELVDGSTVSAADYLQPRIELEVAFVLGAALAGPGITAAEVRRATAGIRPSLELVDSRVADWRIRLADTVADAGSSAAYVLGDPLCPLAECEPTALTAELYRDGELIERGHSSMVLGDPCASVAWLANALAELGESLKPGHVVLSGACTRMVDVHPGESYRGELKGLGGVSLSFAAAEGN